MDNIIKRKTIGKFDYYLRHWPNNDKPYKISRINSDRAMDSKVNVGHEKISEFDTLNEANSFMDSLK